MICMIKKFIFFQISLTGKTIVDFNEEKFVDFIKANNFTNSRFFSISHIIVKNLILDFQ